MIKGKHLQEDVREDSSSSISIYCKQGTSGISNLKISDEEVIMSSSDEEEGFVGKFNMDDD
uniref:Uncharacterized protein n=2 Tax=Lepeophtheirus salmonis TaxID=72036 RepID=A0A0K2UBX7_LEPSM